MTKDSIALIGFMATGKSTVGKALKDRLGKDYQFIETDQIIIEMIGKSIPKIFAEDGEAKFRDYEIEACKKAARLKKTVLSCGGGIVLNKDNVRMLKQNYHLILLTATPEAIYNRAMSEGKENRPVINKKNPFKEIKAVLHTREPLYFSSADFIIDTTDKEIGSIVEEIIFQFNF
jgi:shikimate kinase